MQQETQETEVRETTTSDGDGAAQKQTVTRRTHKSGSAVAQQIVWLVVGIFNAIILIRFILLLFGANRGANFTDFIYGISAPLVSPFVGIFGEPTYGRSVFEISSVLAIVVYSLVGWGVAKLLSIGDPNARA